MDREEEEVESCGAWREGGKGNGVAVRARVWGGQTCGEEGAPPPAVVLSTQVEVAEQNGGLGTHN